MKYKKKVKKLIDDLENHSDHFQADYLATEIALIKLIREEKLKSWWDCENHYGNGAKRPKYVP